MRWKIVIPILLAGIILRAWGLGATSLNTDELFTAKAAFYSDKTAVEPDIHPPLYVLKVRAVGNLFGGSVEVRTRLLSVMSGVLLMLLLILSGYLVAGTEGALIAAVLSAFDPGLIALSRLGRSYAFSSMILGSTFPLLWLVIKRPERKTAAALALMNLASFLTFYYAFFVCAAQVLVALIAGRRDRNAKKMILYANAAAGIAFLPWLIVLLKQAARIRETGGWTEWTLAPYEIFRRAVQVFLAQSPFDALASAAYKIGAKPGAVVAFLIVAAVIALAWNEARKRGADLYGFALADRAGGMGLGLPIAFIAVVFGFALFSHVFFGVFIGFAYFSFLAVPVFAVCVLALSALKNEKAKLAAVAVVVLAQFLMLPSIRGEGREDIREAVRAVDQNASAGAVVFTSAHFVRDGFIVYSKRHTKAVGLPADLPGHAVVPREAPGLMTLDDKDAFFKALGNAPEAWIVLSHETRNGVDRGGNFAREWLRSADFLQAGGGKARAVRWEKYVRPGFLVKDGANALKEQP